MLKSILIFLFLLPSICAIAQIEKMETDRPGQTNTPSTTPNKWVQSEIGFRRQTDKFFYGPFKDIYFQHPSLLAKYGIGKKIEVRFITELTYVKKEGVNSDDINRGTNNTQIGGKFNFLKQKGLIPKTAIIAHYRLNTLNTNVVGRDTINGANVRLAMLHTISDNFSVGYNLGMDWDRFGTTPVYLYSVSPRYSFSEDWLVFIELYGFIKENRVPKTSADLGVSYCINDNFKIDASGGTRINKDVRIKFYSLGASFRFKTAKDN
jgi:hypothetical protein